MKKTRTPGIPDIQYIDYALRIDRLEKLIAATDCCCGNCFELVKNAYTRIGEMRAIAAGG